MNRISIWWHGLSPTLLFVASFLVLIGLGTSGLMLLPGLYTGPALSALDALFTLTSAVCVTGLAVVDTATYFTFWGQLWILIFIQAGGLGLFTLTSLIIGALGRRLSLRSEMISGPPIELTQRRSVAALTFTVCKFTFVFEAAGALLLWIQWTPTFGLVPAAWHAVFHSVSGFCNAGFSTFTTSVIGFNDRPLILLVLSGLVIIGATGWLSLEETARWWKARRSPRPLRLSSHTWSVLVCSLGLLVGGTALFLLFEWDGVLGDMGLIDKLANAWFMAVVPRTAGFAAVPYPEVTNAGAYLTILLMFIGGSPGSTAGGVKTTTLAVLSALALARIRGRRFVTLNGRAVPEQTVQRTISLMLVGLALLGMAVFALSFTEPSRTLAEARENQLSQVFEAMSALATVGLSMDLTPLLSKGGRVIMIFLMFLGRVGPLAFFAALSLKGRGTEARLAHEDVIVG